MGPTRKSVFSGSTGKYVVANMRAVPGGFSGSGWFGKPGSHLGTKVPIVQSMTSNCHT